jgi:hypothetical protein
MLLLWFFLEVFVRDLTDSFLIDVGAFFVQMSQYCKAKKTGR